MSLFQSSRCESGPVHVLHQAPPNVLFSVMEFTDRIEYTFWKKANFDIRSIKLHEGQQLKWFTESEARNTKLAYGFNEIVDDFFKKSPFNFTD